MLNDFFSGAQWGNVPAGIGAILAGFSLILSARAYSRTVDDTKRDQADQIAAWLEKSGGSSITFILKVKNASNLPVYRMILSVPKIPDIKDIYIEALPPDFTYKHSNRALDVALSQPASVEALKSGSQPIVSFADAAGRCWKRELNGKLKLVFKRTHANQWKDAVG